MLKYVLSLFIIIQLVACTSDLPEKPYPCINGDCDANFWIDTYLDDNGYYHLQYTGAHYFTVKGQTSELNEAYVINKVPLIETAYDSDYWVWIDGLTFTVPTYSVLGFFTGGGFKNPIPVGNKTYTITEMSNLLPPLNIVGYQINKNQCLDCPYSPTLMATYSKYTYKPQQEIYVDGSMIGDTARIFMKTTFNSDYGPSVKVEKELRVIFEL